MCISDFKREVGEYKVFEIDLIFNFEVMGMIIWIIFGEREEVGSKE